MILITRYPHPNDGLSELMGFTDLPIDRFALVGVFSDGNDNDGGLPYPLCALGFPFLIERFFY